MDDDDIEWMWMEREMRRSTTNSKAGLVLQWDEHPVMTVQAKEERDTAGNAHVMR